MVVKTHLAAARKARSMGASELARRAGISRQTLHAIESGTYVPNTTVALRLARTLDLTVEGLFCLEEEDAPQQVEAELIASAHMRPGNLVQLCQVGERTIAVPSNHSDFFIGPADAIVAPSRRNSRRASFELVGSRSMEHNLLIAGCDPALPVLSRHAAEAGVHIVPWYCNSSEALDLLGSGKVHIAGCHLHDERTGESNIPSISRHFRDVDVAVVTLASWEEGLVVASENPKELQSIEDLARRDVKIINREGGAGSRKILDVELKKRGILPRQVAGYDRMVHAHVSAARQVAEGNADCCIAPLAVARALGLGFIPLLIERYDFVTFRQFLISPSVQSFFNMLTKGTLRRSLSALGGYDTSATGKAIV
ncbi:MAG TPA: substrate-binding domain-containing protein [Bryobacteraceae bacterium]|nr:substrate-binding domain-containing protein [Bryobacteraceae bacterium]